MHQLSTGMEAYLIVLGGQLVQTLLNDVIAVQVLDEYNDVQAECNNN